MSTIERFEIRALSDQFYANGKQQIRVEIDVLKVIYQNGLPVKQPLSTNESKSLTVVAFSSSTSQTEMPASWSVQPERDPTYDMGIPSRTFEAPAEAHAQQLDVLRCCEAPGAEEGAPAAKSNVPDTYSRYVTASRTSTEKLMARMVLDDGTVITTNMASGGNNFSSSVTLRAIPPLSVPVSQLTPNTEVKQDQKYTQFNPDLHQKITAYYWSLPAGLRALSITRSAYVFYNLGANPNSAKDRFLTMGRAFLPGTTPTNARDNVGGGCVQDYRYTMGVAPNQWAASVLWVSGCSWTSGTNWGTVTFTIVDNYGNTHRYVVSPSGNQGDSVSIAAG